MSVKPGTGHYDYDPISRLDESVQNLAGTANDLILTFTFNPAGQILSNIRSNDSYAFTGLANQNVTNSHNGLNQVTATGGTSVSHDARGNVSAIGASSYGYSSENMLTSAPGGVTLAYDPLLRLYQTSGATVTRLAYDGQSLIAEYGESNNLLRRYVHGSGVDEPIIWYEGTGLTDRRWLHADERGSIVAISNDSGMLTNVNAYDEHGQPQSTNAGRFQYTGQQWLAELGMYHYRARVYSAAFGRFMQTDPIGYGSGMNLYAYVRNDPVNLVDPSGLQSNPEPPPEEDDQGPITVEGRRVCIGQWIPLGNGTYLCSSVLDLLMTVGSLFSPQSIGFHEFLIGSWLVPVEMCTFDEVDEVASNFVFPNQDEGTSVGREVVAADVSGLGMGPILSNSPSPGTYLNTAQPGHIFHGPVGAPSIERSIVQASGWWAIMTYGQGSNYGASVASINEIAGPIIFAEVDQQLRDALRSFCSDVAD